MHAEPLGGTGRAAPRREEDLQGGSRALRVGGVGGERPEDTADEAVARVGVPREQRDQLEVLVDGDASFGEGPVLAGHARRLDGLGVRADETVDAVVDARHGDVHRRRGAGRVQRRRVQALRRVER